MQSRVRVDLGAALGLLVVGAAGAVAAAEDNSGNHQWDEEPRRHFPHPDSNEHVRQQALRDLQDVALNQHNRQ